MFPPQAGGAVVGGADTGGGGQGDDGYHVLDILEDLNNVPAAAAAIGPGKAPRPSSAGSSAGSGGGSGGLTCNPHTMFSNEKIREILELDKNQFPDKEVVDDRDSCDTNNEWKVSQGFFLYCEQGQAVALKP